MVEFMLNFQIENSNIGESDGIILHVKFRDGSQKPQREQEKIKDPAFKQKEKELQMLKKKVDREKEIEDFTNKWVDKWEGERGVEELTELTEAEKQAAKVI